MNQPVCREIRLVFDTVKTVLRAEEIMGQAGEGFPYSQAVNMALNEALSHAGIPVVISIGNEPRVYSGTLLVTRHDHLDRVEYLWRADP